MTLNPKKKTRSSFPYFHLRDGLLKNSLQWTEIYDCFVIPSPTTPTTVISKHFTAKTDILSDNPSSRKYSQRNNEAGAVDDLRHSIIDRG